MTTQYRNYLNLPYTTARIRYSNSLHHVTKLFKAINTDVHISWKFHRGSVAV